jgi:hypothetical protein
MMDCDEFYRASVRLLKQAKIPFLIGGAYAFGSYTGISRDTKDLDIFVQPKDVDRVLTTLQNGGYRCERTSPHWLGKTHCGEYVIDLIYRAGNGLCEVDQSWLDRACDGKLLGIPVKLCAPEEILWMKAFVMERERYDGADIAHLIESCAEKIDWSHLVQRFGPDWRLLLSQLVLFGYIFPSERDRVPASVIGDLMNRMANESGPQTTRVCRGTLVSRQQYLRDIEERGFVDARLEDRVGMTREDIARWTEAIARDGSPAH